jgi:hypothetical protein
VPVYVSVRARERELYQNIKPTMSAWMLKTDTALILQVSVWTVMANDWSGMSEMS